MYLCFSILFIFSLATSNLSSHFWWIYYFVYIFLELYSFTFQLLPLSEKAVPVLWNLCAVLLYMMNYLGTIFTSSMEISQWVLFIFYLLFLFISLCSFLYLCICFCCFFWGFKTVFQKSKVFTYSLTFCLHLLSVPTERLSLTSFAMITKSLICVIIN